MRTQIASLPCDLRSGLIVAMTIAAALVMATNPAAAQTSSPRSQIVYLPDPTPRAVDPHLLLKDDPQVGTSTQEAVEHRNQKRRELLLWAANELVTLSERVQADVTTPLTAGPKDNPAITDAARAAAAANAEKIEQLAKNLTAALKAP